MHILKAVWHKLLSTRKETGLPERKRINFHTVTEEDVYYCYRLLLNREPDEREWSYWTGLVHQHNLGLQSLADNFVGGDEFLQRQAERNKPHLIELPHFRMYVRLNDHFIGAAIAQTKEYEPHIMQALRSILHPGATFIDVGANIGYFSLLAASLVGDDGRVVAFEPRPDNIDLLRKSATENGFNHIQLHEKAVAERRQVVAYAKAGGADTNGRLLSPAEVQPEYDRPMMVEAVTLDETVADLERVDAIKLDIEGAEPKAWQGMQQLVTRHRPHLVLEFSPSLIRMTSQVEPLSFLEELHSYYELYNIDRQTGISETPHTPQDLLQMQHVFGFSHLDLFARPRQA